MPQRESAECPVCVAERAGELPRALGTKQFCERHLNPQPPTARRIPPQPKGGIMIHGCGKNPVALPQASMFLTDEGEREQPF